MIYKIDKLYWRRGFSIHAHRFIGMGQFSIALHNLSQKFNENFIKVELFDEDLAKFPEKSNNSKKVRTTFSKIS